VLVDLPSDPLLKIANGYHRWEAADREKVKKVQAFIGTASLANEKQVLAAITAMQDPKYEDKGAKAGLNPRSSNLRESIVRTYGPNFLQAARTILASQKRDVVARIRAHPAHVTNPNKVADTSPWWDQKHWDDAFLEAMHPQYQGVTNKVVNSIRNGKAMPLSLGPLTPVDPVIIKRVLERAGERITGINITTRDGILELIRKTIAEGIEQGVSPPQLGDAIEAATLWDEYRAERIATTELARAYNEAAVNTYREDGIYQLQAIDGDGDEECAARNGNYYTVDEAETIEDHPNGTLDWVPVVNEEAALGDLEGKAMSGRTKKAAEFIASLAAEDDASEERMVKMVETFAKAMTAEAQRPVIVQPAAITVNLPANPPKRVVRDPKTNQIIGLEDITNG
jgi:SPP1 gp7 family putative phage head morphogenesis protein